MMLVHIQGTHSNRPLDVPGQLGVLYNTRQLTVSLRFGEYPTNFHLDALKLDLSNALSLCT